ncbi:MAG TPA: 3-methyl-2-oxobutanoate hydroxymethyltransferase [Sediminibacterium sp.]|jgi:3-methyl-2-oxobutanoate hydroxymethyltransferase|uniref:3-methyl-2-oxobutanoate hydroxymethyltransferase n=1 Tax=Sediminibacterium sp. TaxID=1917865 RepID=UPI0025E493D8|nr:3-methyl-2-oxobutanoate hydroxymethyltransferase [Sediminibacterium sp.]MBT9484400.1 3-methyl-2-oxobutanoate hydroxymethyltransferase [Sediminibacterium sp.]HQS25120.1 3-methyl-2-oxobutanoate hydroxymethyltransferase [Sediminibacterium sp.]HQS36271.1 3-methyl-2-oxobutanoate hydroxymethyltransferase [Sediminibacterium sp.]
MTANKKTIKTLFQMKQDGQPISMLTAYDYTFARILDAAAIDIILVGDSLSNVFQGNETTLPVTLEEMIYHGKAVMKAVKQAFVVIDLPFGTYQVNDSEALKNAIQLLKNTNAQAVKLEGGQEISNTITKIVQSGIPVMGHLGLTPQSIHQLGSYELQATSQEAKDQLKEDAIALERAGCFAIVLEKIPADLATEITSLLPIPVIGIGAGSGCDGQVLVINDLLGLDESFKPKFVRNYLKLNASILEAVQLYIKDVKTKKFPNANESY